VSRPKPSYVWAAFNARPLGMPIPPNWFGLAAVGLLGALVSPGFLLIGAGLEAGYLYWLSRNARFRKAVDAANWQADPVDQRYQGLLDQLDKAARARQNQIEMRASDILRGLQASPLMSGHADSLEQLVWLHLRLLAARASVSRVVETAQKEYRALDEQEAQIVARLADESISPELRRSLEQQKAVIDQRQAAHEDAGRRLEHIEAELSRIEQQMALIREQTLLASNQDDLGGALDALSASFNEANRWLSSQRDLLGAFDSLEPQRLPERVLRRASQPPPVPQGESQ
jgi:chromosome segregation ATPase